jgi:hypothetical protein
LANSSGGTKVDFTITENTGLILNSYEGASARSIDLRVGGNSALLLASTGAATFSNQVTINGPSADWAAIIQNTNSGAGTSYGLKVKAGTSGAADATFVLQDYAGNEFLTARGNGRIGIGTNSPSYKLHIIESTTNGRAVQGVATATSGTNYGAVLVAEGIGATKNIGLYASAEGATTNVAAVFDSGNVGIGTSSPDFLLSTSKSSTNYISIDNTSNNYRLLIGAETSATALYSRNLSTNAAVDMRFVVGTSESMRITSGGKVGIGTSSPASPSSFAKTMTIYDASSASYSFNVADTYKGEIGMSSGGGWLSTYTNDPFRFITNNTERMRITSGGEVLINTTTNSQTSSAGSKFVSNGRLYTVSSLNDNTQESFSMYSTGSSAFRFYVGWGGTIYATNTTISAISDVRFKENIQDIDLGLDAILALKPRKFDWKEGKGKNIKNDRGFIAQEFEQIFPDLIDEWKDPSPKGEEPYKSVRQDLIPILVKAIQELKAEIDTLKNK